MEEEEEDESVGFSSISRSDIKIEGKKRRSDELDKIHDFSDIQRLNPTLDSDHASKDNEKGDSSKKLQLTDQNMSKVSQSLVKGKSKTDLLGQDVKSSDFNTNIYKTNDSTSEDLQKQALLERFQPDSVAKKGTSLDLCPDAISSCLNDESSVCSSKRRDKSNSMDVSSEKKDSMKLWKAMKQNGFLSNPHGGISAAPNLQVSSAHGGIPAPRKRGRKSKNDPAIKKRETEIVRKEEVVDRFARLAAPTGLLNGLNPGIINHVRNKKQVFSIIQNLLNSENEDSGNFNHPPMKKSNTGVGDSRKNMESVNTDASRFEFNQGIKHPIHYYTDGDFREEHNTVGSKFQMLPKFSENESSLSSEESADFNCASVLTVKAATVASQWLELLHQDIRGRVSALRRSKKRVRAVVTTELPLLLEKEFPADQENDPNLLTRATKASTVNIHKSRWMSLFNKLEQTLSDEEIQLENWLNHVRELQSDCDRGLQHLSMTSGQNFLQLGMPLESRAADVTSLDKDLVVRAAAASIYSTCNFLESKENITCTRTR